MTSSIKFNQALFFEKLADELVGPWRDEVLYGSPAYGMLFDPVEMAKAVLRKDHERELEDQDFPGLSYGDVKNICLKDRLKVLRKIQRWTEIHANAPALGWVTKEHSTVVDDETGLTNHEMAVLGMAVSNPLLSRPRPGHKADKIYVSMRPGCPFFGELHHQQYLATKAAHKAISLRVIRGGLTEQQLDQRKMLSPHAIDISSEARAAREEARVAAAKTEAARRKKAEQPKPGPKPRPTDAPPGDAPRP